MKSSMPLVQYWHAEQIPDDIEELLTVSRQYRGSMPHLIFNQQTAKDFIGVHFTSREVEAFESCAIPAMQADYFRYCAVYALGGVYADANLRWVGSPESLLRQSADGVFFSAGGRPPS